MLVKMRTTACGPDGNLYAGQTYDLKEPKAKALLDGGFAEPVVMGNTPQAPEVAVVATKERAVTPEPKPKRRGRPRRVSGE